MILKTGNLSEYKILVTGASGFLGRQLVKTLLALRASVVGTDCNPLPKSYDRAIKNKSFRFVLGNFRDRADEALSHLISFKKKKGAVFHMAGIAHTEECGKNPIRAFESNVLLTVQVLEFCIKNKINRFVFPSTGLVYGDQRGRPSSEQDPSIAQNIYSATKLSAESMIQGYANSFGLNCIIARLSNVYDSEVHPATVVGTILKQVKNGGKIAVCSLAPVRDFIYIDDVIEGFIRLFVSIDKAGCYIVNLSTGTGSSVQELAETACKAASIPIDRIQSKDELESLKSMLVLDNSLLVKITGWRPKYTLSEGLRLILKDHV